MKDSKWEVSVMPLIVHREFIRAPIEHCFDLARDVDIHTQTTVNTNEQVIGVF